MAFVRKTRGMDATHAGTDIEQLLRVAIIEQIGQDRFDLWLGNRCALLVHGDRVMVECANQLKLDWVRSHLRHDVEVAMRKTLGQQAVLEFRLRRETPAVANAAGGSGKIATSSASPAADPLPFPASSEVSADPHGGFASKSTGADVNHRPSSSSPREPQSSPGRKFAAFSSFIVGDGNRVAYTAAEMVAQRPGSVSPLFIYGPHGVGKTHLLESVWTQTRQTHPRLRTVYLSAEQFTSYFLEALGGKGLPSFRRKYRDAGLLVIDDVQFLLGKRATLVELKSTLDHLAQQGRQFALAADRSPQELAEMGPELTARLGAGLVCGIATPEPKIRGKIVTQAAAALGLKIPTPVCDWLAEHIAPDARMLSGAVNRLWATSVAHGRKIDLSLAEECLSDLTATAGAAVRLKDIDKAVCEVFGLPARSLQSDRKIRKLVYPRMLAMWLARKHTRSALTEIGEYFGRRSHSTVISAERKVGTWMDKNESLDCAGAKTRLSEALGKIEQRLRSG